MRPTARERFDQVVLGAIERVEDRWSARLGLVEYAVEDAPQVPDDWDVEHRIPLSSLVRGSAGSPTRIVLFRRPIERRARDRTELAALVHHVVVQQVAELLGITPEDVDPDWSPLDE